MYAGLCVKLTRMMLRCTLSSHVACTCVCACVTPCMCVSSQVLVTQLDAKKNGYSDVVYLDAKTDT